jgi:hypothetical protein
MSICGCHFEIFYPGRKTSPNPSRRPRPFSVAGTEEFLAIAFSIQTFFHPDKPSQFPIENEDDENDLEVTPSPSP